MLKISIFLMSVIFCLRLCAETHTDKSSMKNEELFKKEREILLKKGCNKNKSSDCGLLGFAQLKNGDKEEAIKSFKQGCNHGQFMDCNSIGNLFLEDGKLSEAREFLKKGCLGYDDGSCWGLSQLELKNGNTKEYKIYLKKSCEIKFSPKCKEIGFQEKPSEYKKETLLNAQSVCNKNNLETCSSSEQEETLLRESSTSLKRMKEQCDNHQQMGCLALGSFTEKIEKSISEGSEVDKNIFKSLKIHLEKNGISTDYRNFYKQACELKSEEACDKLKSQDK